MEEKNKSDKDGLLLWEFLFNNWGKIALFSVSITLIITLIFYFFVDKWYEAKAVVFPSFFSSPSKILVSSISHPRASPGEFGEIIESERLVQIFNSQTILLKVNEKFNLLERYKIKGKKKEFYRLKKKWEDVLDVKRTSYHSVVIKVADLNPDTAALIANYIVELGDSLLGAMMRERAKSAIPAIASSIDSVKKEIILTISEIMKNPQITFASGKEKREYAKYMEQQISLIIEAYPSKAKELLSKMIEDVKNFPAVHAYYRELDALVDHYIYLYTRYLELQLESNANMKNLFVLDKAVPDDKHIFPNMPLVVILSFSGSTFLGAFLLWLYTLIKIKKSEF